MIAFFPSPYEDELLYSQLCRYHRRSGYAQFMASVDDIYNHRTVRPNAEFVNAYTKDAMNWICREMSFSSVIEKRTMFPYYARFLPKERRKTALNALCSMEGNFINILAVPNGGARKFRYCPLCAGEDREKYGETYWHRIHHLQKVDVCPKHGCYLEKTDIFLYGKVSPNFYDAENLVPTVTTIRRCENQIEVSLAKYVAEVFNETVDMESDTPIGYFLHTRLSEKYTTKSGILKNAAALNTDYQEYYQGLPAMNYVQMQKVYNGYRNDNYYICQLAMFEGVSVYELTHLPKEIYLSDADQLYKKISVEYGISIETTKKIGKEILGFARKRTIVEQRSGVRANNWKLLDEEMLPQIKKMVEDFFCKARKPQRLSMALIQRGLQMPQKQLNHLPKCCEYVKKHMETQNEYWARRTEWAVEELLREGKSLSVNMICKKTNIRRKDLETWRL